MRHRESEIYEALRRDDLGLLVASRFEGALSYLPSSDIPELLRGPVTPLMVAAYYGSFRCFNFLVKRMNTNTFTVSFFFDSVSFCLKMSVFLYREVPFYLPFALRSFCCGRW
jgi:hypothetical protein